MDDFDRPLAPRGEEAARLVGDRMSRENSIPDLVLCSPANRTRETWTLVSAQLPAQPPIRFIDDLYDFGDGSAVLDVIRQHGGTACHLLVVGHNPALESLAARLAGPGDDPLRREMRGKFPTAAMAVFDCGIDSWTEVDQGACKLVAFIRPADLLRG